MCGPIIMLTGGLDSQFVDRHVGLDSQFEDIHMWSNHHANGWFRLTV